jgi:hypothetical protein
MRGFLGNTYINGWIIQPAKGDERINNKKLIILLGLLCLSMFSAFAPKVNSQQSTVDWSPMFHHDLAHTGYSSSTGPLTNESLWSFPTDNSLEYLSPAVVNGVVYVGSDDDSVYALNATTGSKIWSYVTGGAVESSPAVVNGVVYIGSDDNNVYAFGSIEVPQPSPPLPSPSPSPSPSASSKPSTSTISNGSLLIIIGIIIIVVIIIGLVVGLSMKKSTSKTNNSTMRTTTNP